MASTRTILDQLPDFYKKAMAPDSSVKLPPTPKTEALYETTWIEELKIYDDYIPRPAIKVSA
jgi:hypothetical protein